MALSISVALCTFNGEAYVAEQVRSILQQTLLPDELIVADDGSTDRTLDIVREVYANYGTTPVALRVLQTAERLGVAKNFERAILEAASDLVALSDQDDRWHPDRLAAAVPSFLKDPDLLLQHTDARLVDSNGEPLGLSLFQALYVSEADKVRVNQGDAFAVLLRRNLVTGATAIVRRRLADIAAPFPKDWIHDEWLALIAAATGHVEVLSSQLIDYRQHGANAIGVVAPTLSRRLRRMLQPRGQRYQVLASRSRELLERVKLLKVSPRVTALAEDKVRFETVRSHLSAYRVMRVRAILLERRRGSYRALSSQGDLDVLRDIVQPR